jgi:hypothetical protein
VKEMVYHRSQASKKLAASGKMAAAGLAEKRGAH